MKTSHVKMRTIPFLSFFLYFLFFFFFVSVTCNSTTFTENDSRGSPIYPVIELPEE